MDGEGAQGQGWPVARIGRGLTGAQRKARAARSRPPPPERFGAWFWILGLLPLTAGAPAANERPGDSVPRASRGGATKRESHGARARCEPRAPRYNAGRARRQSGARLFLARLIAAPWMAPTARTGDRDNKGSNLDD